MKVSEISYRRVTEEEVRAAAEKITARIEKAGSGKELSLIRKDWLESVKDFQTYASLANCRFTLNTKDAFYLSEKEYYDAAEPVIQNLALTVERAFLASPYRKDSEKYVLPLVYKKYEVDLKAADERITKELQEENRTVTEYSKFMSELLFPFRGELLPLPSLKKYMNAGERATRKEAYTALGETLQKNADTLDTLFDRLVKVRTKMARKLGYRDFVELGYYRMGRLCYDRNMVEIFRENILTDVVPCVARLREELAEKIGIDNMKLYDNDAYFAGENPAPVLSVEGIFENGRKMYEEMSPETGAFINMMIESEAFDVLPREGKWGGGYCTSFSKFRQPFILANFNGTAGDIDVLTHEAGHAYAFYETAENDEDLAEGGMETAETHSMSMEFFCWKWMDRFFGARAGDYRRMHLLDAMTFLPYGTIVDYFQHIVYENPEMTPVERNGVWKKLEAEFRPYMDAEGIPYLEEGTRWQYQMHIFESPFYYIDYCLAQCTALQFLLLSQKDYDDAFARYRKFLKTGGEKVFTELVKEAGLKSPFEPGALASVMKEAEALLRDLEKRA